MPSSPPDPPSPPLPTPPHPTHTPRVLPIPRFHPEVYCNACAPQVERTRERESVCVCVCVCGRREGVLGEGGERFYLSEPSKLACAYISSHTLTHCRGLIAGQCPSIIRIQQVSWSRITSAMVVVMVGGCRRVRVKMIVRTVGPRQHCVCVCVCVCVHMCNHTVWVSASAELPGALQDHLGTSPNPTSSASRGWRCCCCRSWCVHPAVLSTHPLARTHARTHHPIARL
jgi:hypothetical protein